MQTRARLEHGEMILYNNNMKKAFLIMFFTTLLALGVQAKTLEQKKTELKKIYEAGGITKAEYNKAQEFLENSEEKTKEKKSKRAFDLSKKKEIGLCFV